MIPATVFADTTKLTAIQITKTNNASRLTLTLNQSVASHVFTLKNPDRLIVDFEKTHLNATTKNNILVGTGIRNLRIGYPDQSTLRLVLDLENPVHYEILSKPRAKKIVLDIKTAPKNFLDKFPQFKPLLKPIVISKPLQRTIVVVIDAGHGGKDSGAIGPMGTKEKDVTLGVAKKLAEIINQQPRMHAVLTRDGDYYVRLRDRLKLARKGKADLFIALHADSYFNNQANGASIYTLSQHGATTEAARWLAQRDNYSELGGVDLSELADKSYLLRSVLIDLAQTATITDSLHMGGLMLNSLRQMTELHYSHVEQAPFMVLKSPDIPSVLVEMGFISNQNEEFHLRDKKYQSNLARALFNGVQFYLKKYPITGV